MHLGHLLKTALVTTGMVLLTIYLLRRIPFTSNLVAMAFAG